MRRTSKSIIFRGGWSTVALPLIPREFFGVNCCGCLGEMIGEETQFVRSEYEAVIPVEDVHLRQWR